MDFSNYKPRVFLFKKLVETRKHYSFNQFNTILEKYNNIRYITFLSADLINHKHSIIKRISGLECFLERNKDKKIYLIEIERLNKNIGPIIFKIIYAYEL